MRKFLLCLLIFPFYIYGQNKIDFNQGIIVQKDFCDTLPFEYVRNKIIVDVKINGQKKKFILDTGATLCISDNIQEDMKNPILGYASGVDAYGQKRQVSFVTLRELQLGNLTFQKIPSGVINLKNIEFLSCFNADGFIGSNLLKNCIVHIDTEKKYIVLTDNINKLNLKNVYKTSLILDSQSEPYLQLNLNNKLIFYALFDSGADDFITISNRTLKTAIKKGTIKLLNQGYGIGGVGMFGAEKAERKKRLIGRNVKFGSDEITDFVTEFSSKSYDAIGMELADYGTITIDYINKEFYFKVKKQSQSYLYQKTIGFSFQPEKNYYSIGQVWTGTKAEKNGLRNGFQILKLDNLDISKRTKELDCELLFSRPLRNGKLKVMFKNDKNQVKIAELNEE
jgi:Aspartyl protease